MLRIFFIFIFTIIYIGRLRSQVIPKESDTLNYRIVGFTFTTPHKTHKYRFEIANGTHKSDTNFIKNIFKSIEVNGTRLITEVPAFGKPYTWRLVDISNNTDSIRNKMYHFHTGYIPEVDSTLYRLRIIKKGSKYIGAYIFSDATKVLYDMNGKPVWYLPSQLANNNNVRDIKLTHYGTITYVIDELGVFETNYNGNIIWQGPNNGVVSKDRLEHYHHEFTRLSNGDYMALAQNFQYWKRSTPEDTVLKYLPVNEVKKDELDRVYERCPMGTLIQYDTKGNVVWYWKASDHFNGSTLFYRNEPGGGMQMRAHENSFFFDDQAKVIYLSLRNINSILKIKYPEGTIIRIYNGEKSTLSEKNQGFFCGQHSCKVSSDGHLYLYNNNSCNKGAVPKILMLKESQKVKNSLEKIWEYTCNTDTLTNVYPSGGNVIELPDKSMFVSMAFPDSRIFIVAQNKKMLWCTKVENWNQSVKKWEPVNLYRASIITSRDQLEKLIWGTEYDK